VAGIAAATNEQIVKQVAENGCGASCGQALLKGMGVEASQAAIAKLALMDFGVKGIQSGNLAGALSTLSGKSWVGGMVDVPTFSQLSGKGPLIALLNPAAPMGHYVVVDSMAAGRLAIRDPYGLVYSMTEGEFIRWWGEMDGFGTVVVQKTW
jgi:predicted double-glycine peptidase